MSVILISRNQASEVLQPADGTLDFPSSSVATKFSAILGGWLPAAFTMWTDEFRPTFIESTTQRVTVGCFVVDQSSRPTSDDALIEQRLDQRYLSRTGTRDRRRERQPMPVGEDHGLSALASLGLAYQITPFFAEENVPSAIVSFQLMRPFRSSLRSKRAQASSQIPASVHRWSRRQHVVGDGKDLGRSFHRAPVRSIQRIPSTQLRGSIGGRPRQPVRASCGNRSEISRHCSSVSSCLGSILDPAGQFARKSRDRTDMVVSFLTTNTDQNRISFSYH